MRVQWMEHEQRSRGLEHGDEHFRFFMCTRATLDSPERCESRHGSNSSELSSFQSPILLSKTLQISRSVHLFGGQVERGLQLCCPFYARTNVSLKLISSESSARRFSLLSRPFLSRANKKLCVNFSQSDYLNAEATPLQSSEIRRRLFVTAVLLVISRVGYFIPLPGFDRRLMPEDYLSFVSGSVDELGDFAGELKLSLFQLGISPQIAASILMQVLCHVVPSLVKLRKEGLDGHEKIKSYIWWISLGFAILEALVLACYSLTYSVYAASHRVKHVMVTTLFLVCGAMTMTWICDKYQNLDLEKKNGPLTIAVELERRIFKTVMKPYTTPVALVLSRIISNHMCGNFDWIYGHVIQDVGSAISNCCWSVVYLIDINGGK
ncbi:Preprotein translocase subunit SCY2, chloroplastic [Vitis vinifera]|uniref:Preprotein translocase subunit SCY2, chloroplastic n=1 Tax=Vitis vinifera TaxID=29760 RepID=A0A438KIA8_VITVI|nr:Preprotein translocase subunit SCY2, chloroplastic [Vitis vinifera]